MSQVSMFKFSQILTDSQLEHLWDLEDYDGFGGANMIITHEGVLYLETDYSTKTITEHFTARVNAVIAASDTGIFF